MGKHREESDEPTVQELWDAAEAAGEITPEMRKRRMNMAPNTNAPQHSIADTPRGQHETRNF